MNYTMREKEAFEVVSKPFHVSAVNSTKEEFRFWEELNTRTVLQRQLTPLPFSVFVPIKTEISGSLRILSPQRNMADRFRKAAV
ncbi:hypothetical protein J7E26_15060 [Bacillus sp. ISL-51]|uniref:hypothetical protein n=1 Tax=Bacteria TaxID=2 RepID=UPI001BEC616D|nr:MULTISPECIES: hypothetical protein [Bacteria]MBT2575246.1 hypothetical protein [Bacillus sp. ISL-51]MBT2712881.1 hypothetical protein [Pseudomonas sp. ISL-88]